MKNRNINRIVLFSKEAMSWHHKLSKVEELIKNCNLQESTDINDYLEFYQIKLYFDNGLFLPEWNQFSKNKIIDFVNSAWLDIKDYWLTINDSNIEQLNMEVEYSYIRSFWNLISMFQAYKKIDSAILFKILASSAYQIYEILAVKNIVQHYDEAIREFLLQHKPAAEILISHFEENSVFKKTTYFFPKSLSITDKEKIILQYINSDKPNLNYIRLIENSKDSPSLKLSRKTRLSAKKVSEKLNNEILAQDNVMNFGAQLSFAENQKEIVKFSRKGNIKVASYSLDYIDSLNKSNSLFHLFSFPFVYLDLQGLITLVSKENELDVLEKTSTKSKNEYATGVAFMQKDRMAYIQLRALQKYAVGQNASIESIIQLFVQELSKKFKIENLRFKLPTDSSTFSEKIRFLSPELESILQQFQCFIDEGMIDHELLGINSSTTHFTDIESLVPKKYVYENHQTITILKNCFYSNQSPLYYVDPFKEKYKNLFALLTLENVKYSMFEQYQKNILDQLIEEDHLFIDKNDCLKITNEVFLKLIGDLHTDEVISYWHRNETERVVIDKMVNIGYFKFECSLLSKLEKEYFNYFLNKKQFTNGLDIRNKYAHGTNSDSENIHEHEYYLLLRMVILALLKIEDDLYIKFELQKT